MKVNLPVTDKERKLRAGQELVTQTDLKGIITYVNPAFVEVSGFTEVELVGKNHNVVRHPDMPPEAFKDLWETLKLGRPWCKMVKNRCKNGDYYWVKANVTPIYESGEMIGYMSVRTTPNEEEVQAAAALYTGLREKKISLPSPQRIQTRLLEKKLYSWAAIAALVMLVVSGGFFVADMPDLALLGPFIAFIMMLAGALSNIKHYVQAPLDKTVANIRRVGEGDYHTEIDVEGEGELGELDRATKSLAIKLGFDVNSSRLMAQESSRIKQALDSVSSNVMMADNNGLIIYMNTAIRSMFRIAEDDIRQDLPDFDAETLVGRNFDDFHKNPEHQRNVLAKLSSTFQARIGVGTRTFDLVANPVIDGNGERLGTVVEWKDLTEQLKTEQDIENLIRDASAGMLSQRLDVQGLSGFTKAIASNVNQLLDAVVEPVRETKRVLSAMAEGDLTQTMQGNFSGDFEDLNNALNSSLEKLQTMVADIRSAGANITTGASEIAQGNATLSQRTESQAASLEETAASMEQMTSTVRQNAENAQEASRLAEKAKVLAEDGSSIAEKVVRSMGDISTSSKKIAEIIGVIDEIAFQTNLLALNAAVEAARAGEQGRGFAVVASEVRNLAQRSAAAAKEIKELISDSVEKVEEGGRYVDESGRALNEIMSGVQQVSSIISEIATASREQASGIEQVNIAVNNMDEGTQQNAALVEQVAAASESMEEQAQQLQRLVNVFKVHMSGHTQSGVQGSPALIKSLHGQPAAQRSAKQAPVMTSNSSDEEWEEF